MTERAMAPTSRTRPRRLFDWKQKIMSCSIKVRESLAPVNAVRAPTERTRTPRQMAVETRRGLIEGPKEKRRAKNNECRKIVWVIESSLHTKVGSASVDHLVLQNKEPSKWRPVTSSQAMMTYMVHESENPPSSEEIDRARVSFLEDSKAERDGAPHCDREQFCDSLAEISCPQERGDPEQKPECDQGRELRGKISPDRWKPWLQHESH